MDQFSPLLARARRRSPRGSTEVLGAQHPVASDRLRRADDRRSLPDDIVAVLTAASRRSGAAVRLLHRSLRRRLAGAREALRRRLSPAQPAQEPPHPHQGRDRRGHAGALDQRRLSRRDLVRARGLRLLRHPLLRQPGLPPHPHRLRLPRPSAAQGLPAHRLRRGPLRRRAEARRLRAGEAAAGIPQLRFPVALGRDGLRAAGDEKAE